MGEREGKKDTIRFYFEHKLLHENHSGTANTTTTTENLYFLTFSCGNGTMGYKMS